MRGITDDDMENVRCELNTKPGFDDWEGYTNYAIATWERFSEYHEKRRVLWCWDRVLWQNRCALAAGSPYFEALFFSPLSAAEGKQRVNLTTYAMKTVELPALAEFLQLDLLLEKLVGSLRCSINIHNCFKWIKEVVCHTKALLNCY